MNMYFKKCIAILFIALTVLVPALGTPRQAHAALGFLDTSFDLAAFGTGILQYAGDIGEYAARAAKWIEEGWQKTMRDVIAKRIIDYTVDETVKWVQGGGDPKFISDWNGFMKEAGEIAFDSVIKDAKLSDICEPFALQLRVALIPETRFNRERVNCTISDIVANVQDFYDNFQNGGWLAYGESIKPQNNLYMQLVMFDDEINLRTAFNEDQRRQQSAAGQGFLSVSTCVENDGQQLYDDCIAGGGGDIEECYAYAQQAMTCTKEAVQTPGSVVGGALVKAMGSDGDWAANIESWTSALVNAAINRLTREGVAAMTGSSSGAAASYDPASLEYGDMVDAQLESQKKDLIAQIQTITVPYQQLLTEKQTTKTYTEQILDLFAQLDLLDVNKVCVPQTTTAEVAAQQSILNTLTARISQLQPVVTEGNAVIAQLQTMTGSIRDTSIMDGKVTAYLSKYSVSDRAAVQLELQNPDGKNDSAIKDRETQLATLRDVQSRFTQCKSRIDLMAAPAS
ncbi:hypothetical protein A2524_04195 [Candidatus Wolfebacteria bacterium RIFOXYD12_FULL_48_21]|uniref:Uncharacterized protein n=1 Tax=Candidatus Wolfebacteria bacterium RIFOXYD1_FULL_48_65 TaxID=1802561 RepID=A0A1F8DZW4_9BACT|nr:MAG: hypothetical protein A2610_01830 [Candidatus Wolfebacteria bacterium RIFOXYD1_FULL_48_65]OGM95385.1 MAG: hypothetical protein A2524_04195 [Candidatus Wolfebacteria bacterium RIFOXYD12_FULL_48_21]OGM97699.1 MAG: hypothetical protein A2532_04435 [Candidatus Wolfebacteria bacterium RIFOXYD2_FULL_48_11]